LLAFQTGFFSVFGLVGIHCRGSIVATRRYIPIGNAVCYGYLERYRQCEKRDDHFNTVTFATTRRADRLTIIAFL
jgi:hypothetical protein